MPVLVTAVFQLWYAHRPPEDDHFRGRAYSTSDVHDSILPESMKLHAGVNSNGDLDAGDVNLSEMDPEDIRVRGVSTQRQTEVTAYWESKQLPQFVFGEMMLLFFFFPWYSIAMII